MLKKCLKMQCPGNPVCVCAQRAWGRNGTPVTSMVASEGCVVDLGWHRRGHSRALVLSKSLCFPNNPNFIWTVTVLC